MLFQIDIQLCATCYVRADSEEAALAKATKFSKSSFEFASGAGISDLQLDDPKLPDVSLSPAMTGHGIWPGAHLLDSASS